MECRDWQNAFLMKSLKRRRHQNLFIHWGRSSPAISAFLHSVGGVGGQTVATSFPLCQKLYDQVIVILLCLPLRQGKGTAENYNGNLRVTKKRNWGKSWRHGADLLLLLLGNFIFCATTVVHWFFFPDDAIQSKLINSGKITTLGGFKKKWIVPF